MASNVGNPFRTFKRRETPDPSPKELTEAEREYILDCLRNGSAPRAGLVRKILRLADESGTKLRRVSRVVEQANAMPSRYSASTLQHHITDIISGEERFG